MLQPPHKMTERQMIDWVYENDYLYYAQLVCDSASPLRKLEYMHDSDLFDCDIYDTVYDAVMVLKVYSDYILEEENE